MVDAPSDVAPEAPAPQWPNSKENYELLDVIGQSVSTTACPLHTCSCTCASLLKGTPETDNIFIKISSVKYMANI